MPAEDAAERALTDAIDALTKAYEEAAAAVDAINDPHRAFTRATELADKLRGMADSAAILRAQTVGRIWKAEEISLAALAKRIGVSKARADQFVKTAKRAEQEGQGK